MRVSKTIIAVRDAAIFLSSAANNFRHGDFSGRIRAKCKKRPPIADFLHAADASDE
jgi:hypothetical protein